MAVERRKEGEAKGRREMAKERAEEARGLGKRPERVENLEHSEHMKASWIHRGAPVIQHKGLKKI